MATLTVPVLNSATIPTAANGNVYPAPSSSVLTNDLYPGVVLIFQDTGTKDSVSGRWRVPANYVGSSAMKLAWASGGTSGNNVVWDLDYRAIASGEGMDPTTHQESITVTEADDTTAWDLVVSSITITAGNLAAGDIVEFLLSRDGANASDTLASDVALFWAEFQYADV